MSFFIPRTLFCLKGWFLSCVYGARGGTRTRTPRGNKILSLACLPVPPPGQIDGRYCTLFWAGVKSKGKYYCAMTNKERVYEILSQQHLISPRELLQEVRGEMDRATLYRVLKKLVEEGSVREVHGHGGSLYEVAEDDHQHVHCHSCESYVPVHIDKKTLSEALGGGFDIDQVDIHLSGTCPECKK